MKDILPLSPDDFGLFQKLLIETSGLHFDEGRNQSFRLALWQRLQHRGYDSYREYYNLLRFHPEGRLEIRELFDLITIGETYFFRNKAQFDVLMRFVLPEIIQRKVDSGDKCIRAWSAGCSRGDEAYSIAMAMMEVFPSFEEWNISILGTDINRKSLACSEEAVYGEKDVGHLPKEYLEKYFKGQGSTYHLRDDVKELVEFEYHNLARDPCLHEKMQNVDIIFCRNVIIYFDLQTTQRVIENSYNCLAQDGYLFLGHTENLWQITNRFERVEFPQTFIYKKRLGPVQEDAMKPFMAVPEINIENLTVSEAPIGAFDAEVKNGGSGSTLSPHPEPFGLSSRRKLAPKGDPKPSEQVEDPTLRVDEPSDAAFLSSFDHTAAQDKSHSLAGLAKATILANEAKYKEAADILRKIVKADNLSVEAYYLLGVLSYKSGDLKEAEAQFRKVIYVAPDSVLAYFNLGNMYLYQRKLGEAAREYKNAIRLLEKKPKDEHVRFCEDFTVEFLLRACRNTLVQISRRGG
jgi:chemotaxis protein methyltransferase CheR